MCIALRKTSSIEPSAGYRVAAEADGNLSGNFRVVLGGAAMDDVF
jgi:hypothetical protein